MKKYLLGIFAVVLALGFSAFSTPKKSGKLTQQYFRFKDYPVDTYKEVASHYESIGSLSCTVGTYRCGVLANPDSGNPDIPDMNDTQLQILEKN